MRDGDSCFYSGAVFLDCNVRRAEDSEHFWPKTLVSMWAFVQVWYPLLWSPCKTWAL